MVIQLRYDMCFCAALSLNISLPHLFHMQYTKTNCINELYDQMKHLSGIHPQKLFDGAEDEMRYTVTFTCQNMSMKLE